MNVENTNKLLNNYPKLYRQHSLPMTETCMCWLFEVGDGWMSILDDLSRKIENLNMTVYKDDPIEAVQVKEKFGTLRVYVNNYSEEVEKYIDEAERLSEITCEECGAPGKIRPGGWITVKCDDCQNKKNKE